TIRVGQARAPYSLQVRRSGSSITGWVTSYRSMFAASASGSFSNSNFGEWTPITTSSSAHFSSRGRSSSSTCRQFTQQKVQKSSSTIFPRRDSRSSSAPPVFSQPRPRRAEPWARPDRGVDGSGDVLMGSSEHRIDAAGPTSRPRWTSCEAPDPWSPARDPRPEVGIGEVGEREVRRRGRVPAGGHGDQPQSGVPGGARTGPRVLEGERLRGLGAEGAGGRGVHVGGGLGALDRVGGLQHREVVAEPAEAQLVLQ